MSVQISDDEDYDLLGVRWYGNGCHSHSRTKGSELKTRKLNRVRASQIVYNKMWVSKGAFAVVPRHLDGAHATAEYPNFDVRLNRLDPHFIEHYMRQEAFKEDAILLCKGSTSRARLNPSDFLNLTILLPPLHEQRRIAEILSSVDDAIVATRATIEQTRRVKQAVLERLLTKGFGHRSFKHTEIGEIPEEWRIAPLSTIAASIDSGWSPDCEKIAASDGEWGVLKTSAVVWDGYQAYENKRLPDNLTARPEIEVKAGDVLVTRAGPVDRTGVVALVRSTPQKLMLSDKIIRIQTKAHECEPSYLSLWLSSPSAQNEIVKKKSGMALSQTNISQKALRELFVPLPPIDEQIEIANTIQSIEESIGANSEKLYAMLATKSALMSDLLSGRKRVTESLPMAAE